MDALNSWLKVVRANGLVLVRTRVAGPWGFVVQPRDAVVFHFVAEGRAFVRQSDTESMELRAGELVLFPRGDAHEVVHSARGKAMPLEAFLARRDGVVDRDPKAVTLICGQFNMDLQLALPALRALPQAVSLRAGTEPGCSPLSDTLRMLRNEVETPNFGNQIVVRNLLSSLFIFFMRDWADTTFPAANDWFAAVRSPQMARALARMHEAPERAWTLEELAQEAGLSRAAFARNFNASVGEPPHSYLTRWRMGVAAQLLQETSLRLGEIASRVGYRSEFSFSRAFKSARGISPIQYRHEASNRA
ncbi:AraC family transcriptional regulator [Paraburkholderia caffeinilytica]|uniref:AraC family transcriptional regulator n=1 Tax=Paraburkholderia caffeinilytica TaxID=1761016 RepID=A0ABQ1NIQ8_9BURK|nr:AraC family transcriptional regulator [Paraburkholderia caffeinilytica]AXL50834.1 AraC family transcriptional regulator [Paraburkholderia caffeinilytica]GGC66389.1 AraC family transcriptional regulator [Paraburkholderia caffeinilytica]CAB3803715.1 HTH-type transcriptional regulator MtrA [Paraburkholderia caffeinilytica]